MWPTQKVGGGEVEIPPSLCFSPQTSHELAQRKVQCVLYIYLFNLKVKGHLFMSPFQAHKKWDDWVKQGCRILLLCDGLQVIPTELFKGEGAEGREREQSTKLLNKYCCDWNTVIHIYTSHNYKTEFMKSSTCIYFL